MSRTKLVLIGLAAAVVLALGAAVGLPALNRAMNSSNSGRITIAIATDETVERLFADEARQSGNSDKIARFLNGAVTGSPPPQSAPATGAATSEGAPPTGAAEGEFRFPSDVAAAFSQVLMLQLDGQLTQGLDSSNRFAVVDSNAVETALRRMTNSEGSGTPQSLIQTVFRATSGGTHEEARQRNTGGADLVSIGRELDADYFLYVGVEEPVYSVVVERDEMTGERLLMFKAQPTFVFRLFDTRSRTVRLAGVLRFAEPMIAYGEQDQLSEYLIDERGNDQAADGQRREQGADAAQRLRDMPIMQDLAFQVNRELARQVIQRVLEDLAPAEIVGSGEAITANRGSNDGLLAGMEMEVYRLSDEPIRESGGREIGYTRERKGIVRVADVQENTAALSVVSGGPFERGDRLAMPLILMETMGDVAAADAATPAAAPQALGRDAIIAQQRGDPAAIRPAIAIDSIDVRFDTTIAQGQDNMVRLSASRSLADALQGDPRIVVLPRADLQRLARERRIAAQAAGRSSDPRRGMAVGEYYLTGEVSIDSSVDTPSVSYEGVSRATGPARLTARARGSYRIMTMDGRAAGAAEAEQTATVRNIGDLYGIIDSLSTAAARELMSELFPMQIASVDDTRQRYRINAGAGAGLAVNSRLRVYSVGSEPVFDPVTRVMLSAGERNLSGELIVIDVQPDISTARFASDRFSVAIGDEVELAPTPRRSRSAASAAEPRTEVAPQTAGPTPF